MFNRLLNFIAGPGFALWLLAVLFFVMVLTMVALLFPFAESSPAANFIEEFKVWCFGYNAETGEWVLSYLVMFFFVPLCLGGITLLCWWEPLRQVWTSPLLIIRHATLALIVTCLGIAGMFWMYQSPPAEKFSPLALRTNLPAIPFTLINHEQQEVSLSDFRGEVVMITGVYSTCGYTCPMIMAQAKSVVEKLTAKEKEQLTVLAITLDPQQDNPDQLKRMASSHQLGVPLFHFLTGECSKVNDILDLYGFARKKNPETGVLDHANLFLLIDKQGRLAYRFSLGEKQQQWTVTALRDLLQEQASKHPNGT